MTAKPIDSKYRSNGRSKKACDKIEQWQRWLDDGFTIKQIVDKATAHRKDKTTAINFYTKRIVDLVEDGVLKL